MSKENGSNRTILVVDDDTFLLNFLSLVLQKAGYKVITAQDGKEGLELAKKHKPEIILSDLMMPVMDGEGFLQSVRQLEEFQDTLFLILTAKTDKSDRIQLLQSGADDFITKPISKDELLAKLQAFERIQNLQQELRRKNEILQRLNRKLQQTTSELRKTNELLQSTQDQLIQSEKLASIGQLAAGVAHEINNPLGVIQSNLNVLKDYIAETKALLSRYEAALDRICQDNGGECPQLQREIEAYRKQIDFEFLMRDFDSLINDSLSGAERIKNIVENLRDFSDLDHTDFLKTDIHTCLENALNIAWNEIRYRAEVIREYQEVPEFYCFPRQLSQAFLNLLLNAAQSVDDQGKIIIRTFTEDGKAIVEIEDNGVGIPKEFLPRIFEPFFTTKEVGEGTGLGLSVAYNIIKRHQGKIKVESELGKGTLVRVELPLNTDKELLPVKYPDEGSEIRIVS